MRMPAETRDSMSPAHVNMPLNVFELYPRAVAAAIAVLKAIAAAARMLEILFAKLSS